MKKTRTLKKEVSQEGVLKDQLTRALADYDNLTKRVEREREGFAELANLRFVLKFLPIFDMLEQSQKHLKDPGIAIALKELYEALETESIVRISAREGEDFDESVHEVVEVVDGDNGKIVECVLTGWRYDNGQVIRPAKVKVGKGLEK